MPPCSLELPAFVADGASSEGDSDTSFVAVDASMKELSAKQQVVGGFAPRTERPLCRRGRSYYLHGVAHAHSPSHDDARPQAAALQQRPQDALARH